MKKISYRAKKLLLLAVGRRERGLASPGWFSQVVLSQMPGEQKRGNFAYNFTKKLSMQRKKDWAEQAREYFIWVEISV